MEPGLLRDRADLETLFGELADELATLGASAEVVMVGGSWMLWHAHRASTCDVDSGRRLPSGVAAAVDRIGARHDLRQGWLNDAAAAFWPSGIGYDECTAVFDEGGLVVRAPSPDVIFVMKLYRADPQDREDLVALWPRCTFADPHPAAASYRRAYPHAPDDEYLADFIADVVVDATSG